MKQIINMEFMVGLTMAQIFGLVFFDRGGFLCTGISLIAIYMGIVGIHKQMTAEKKDKKWITAYWAFTILSAVALVIGVIMHVTTINALMGV